MDGHIDPAVWARARVAQEELRRIRREYRERDRHRWDQQEEGTARQRHGNIDQEDRT